MPKSKRHLQRRKKKPFLTSNGGSSTSTGSGGLKPRINPINRHSEKGMVIRHEERRIRNGTPTGLAMRLNQRIEDQEHWFKHRKHVKRK